MSRKELPDSSSDNKNTKGRLTRVVLRTGGALLVGAAAVVGVKSTIESLIDLIDDSSTQIMRTENLDGLRTRLGIPQETEIDTDSLLNEFTTRYWIARESFINLTNYEFKLDPSDQARRFIEEERVALVIDGAILVKQASQDKLIEIDQGDKKVKIDGTEFDLKNLYQLFLADRIINEFLTTKYDSSTDRRFEATQNLADLTWLAKQNLSIVFEPDSFVFPPEKTLVHLARFTKTLSELGHLPLAQIIYQRYSGDGPPAWYENSTKTIHITNEAGEAAIIHEESHHQGFNNQEFSQTKFNQLVLSARESVDISENEESTHINPNVLNASTLEEIQQEDFAETLNIYFMDGVSFRRAIKTLQSENPVTASVLKAKYNFAKSFFGGKEYLKNGIISEPKIGEVYAIDDPDEVTLGIFLRPQPNLEKSQEFPLVFDGNRVRIIRGPLYFTDNSTGTVKRLWLVETGFFYREIRELKWVTDSSGWISEEWLGDLLIRAEEFKE